MFPAFNAVQAMSEGVFGEESHRHPASATAGGGALVVGRAAKLSHPLIPETLLLGKKRPRLPPGTAVVKPDREKG
jgi:hypothetical protein